VRSEDVFEHAVLVKEAFAPHVADDDTVVVNTYEPGACLLIITVIQSCEASVAINEAVIDSDGIVEPIGANNHAVVIEGDRKTTTTLCARKTWHTEKRAITATLEAVVYSVAVLIVAEKSVEIVDGKQLCAVVRRLGMYDQSCC